MSAGFFAVFDTLASRTFDYRDHAPMRCNRGRHKVSRVAQRSIRLCTSTRGLSFLSRSTRSVDDSATRTASSLSWTNLINSATFSGVKERNRVRDPGSLALRSSQQSASYLQSNIFWNALRDAASLTHGLSFMNSSIALCGCNQALSVSLS